jgi:hypothetical protein
MTTLKAFVATFSIIGIPPVHASSQPLAPAARHAGVSGERLALIARSSPSPHKLVQARQTILLTI